MSAGDDDWEPILEPEEAGMCWCGFKGAALQWMPYDPGSCCSCHMGHPPCPHCTNQVLACSICERTEDDLEKDPVELEHLKAWGQ